jgi:hypothetical protein
MAELRGGHVLDPKERFSLVSKSCVGPGLVLLYCGKWSEAELQRQQQHRAVTGDYSYHDQHPALIPAFTQYHFY